MAWRREQRENERLAQMYQAIASVEAGQARIARVKFQQARTLVHAAQDRFADAPRSQRARQRLLRRLARARALLAGRRTALLWHGAYSRWQRSRAAESRLAAEALKAQIAGG